MKTLQLRSVTLGSGRPKVCVPLVGRTLDELRRGVQALVIADLDLVELRIDLLAGAAEQPALVQEALGLVRGALPSGVPVLFTYRTTREGGNQPISADGYTALLVAAITSGAIDAVDVEMLTPNEGRQVIVAAARAASVAVVMSNHEFTVTPPKDEIIRRLVAQQELGADVTKIAVMPTSARDVVTLLDATEEFVATHALVPTITMSMGSLGAISRLAGETFGSSLTFGAVGASSAPGQLEAGELRGILDILHRSAR